MIKTKLFSVFFTFFTVFSVANPSEVKVSDTTELKPSNSFLTETRSVLFKIASKLTDPVCKSHEYFRRFYIEEALHPTPFKMTNVGHASFLFVRLTDHVRAAMVTTLPGIALRLLAVNIQKEPFIYLKAEDQPIKTLPENRTFSLFSWNICCVGAGYPISDGGVLPWSLRIHNIVDKIIEKNADVNCLYETFDTTSAFYIYERLKTKGYSHFYFNIGPKALGASSGIFVASKYAITNPEFVPFSQDSLVGRTKNVEKGVFAFNLQSDGQDFARVFTTHLQHSEQPEFSTDEERKAREEQMKVILNQIQKQTGDKCLIVTGDLNLDDEEFASSSWHQMFEKENTWDETMKTWGGDAYCATMVGKKVSSPLNLDHTMVVKGTAHLIHTSLVDVNFDGKTFNETALSDHLGLFSEIGV